MILTTTDTIQDAIVQSYLGIVTAEVVCGHKPLQSSPFYEKLLEEAQQKVLSKLEQRARALSADAVIGIKIHTIASEATVILMVITATGTAVKIR
jgi:uncharacterized protein YbjQ (UPF0145 family)